MRNTSLAVLALVTAVTVAAAAVAVTRTGPTGVDAAAAGTLFPGLKERINDVARLEIATSRGRVGVTRAADGAWVVADKDGYPADMDAVKGLVVALADMTAVEPRTALADLYPRIGVEDAGPGAGSTAVVLEGVDGKPLASLLLGKTASATPGGGGTHYVRRAGEERSWLARGRVVPPDSDPLRWLDRRMPQIPRDRVMAVEIRQSDGSAVTVSRPDPQTRTFTAEGLPGGAEPRASAVEEVVGALAYVSFEDVRRADPDLFADAATAIIRTFDGVVLTVRTARRDDADWITIAAAYDAAAVTPDAAPAHPALPSPEAAQAQAQYWQARHSGWAYRVLRSTADPLRRRPEAFAEG
ncbi:DUF4340 domain-containing protein [Azospirillum halopraeferens]|uniref:DUF4340 domain-containing protein n=1 Tax=Azospirillum halopraeferens TaxID=34010 RepID=UPI00041280E6|nr:DUF4340 domain-containing protein [Azospirillum halopraeferens]